MLKNYFKIAFRNMISHRFYSLINIVGLSIGITACILVWLYVKFDLSYDKYHRNAEQIYRIEFSFIRSGNENYMAQTPGLLGPTIKNEYPEVKKLSRLYFPGRILVNVGNIKNFEDRIAYADSSFFEIFDYEAILGDKSQFLKKPNTIILTESISKKYFGNENPIGKVIGIKNKYNFEICGVIKDVPSNSHFKFDFLATYSSLDKDDDVNYLIPQWGATFGSYTYMLVDKGFDAKAFEKKTSKIFSSHMSLNHEDWRVIARPLLWIHLNSHQDDEIQENSSMSRIYIISSIALFILLLACINFVNLSTARSSKRAVEIGIRKVLGAVRLQLVKQFLGESIILAMASFVISIFSVILIMPSFSALVGTKIEFDISNNWTTVFLIIAGVLFVGFLAGIYPALFVSSYQPIKVIKENISSSGGKKGSTILRKGLVILQFSISIILIVGTLIVNLQLKYMRNYNMGFDKDYMISLPVQESISDKYKTVLNELKNIPGVINATVGMSNPISSNKIGSECKPNGVENNSGAFGIKLNSVDYNYMEHFGVKIVAGRNFSEEFPSDFPNTMIVNEKFVKNLGFKNPQDALGKSYFISVNEYSPKIIGVVKDFNSSSLHNEISAEAFMINPRWFSEFTIKVNTKNIPSTIDKTKDVMTKFFPQYPFEYSFLDDSIDKLYKSEETYSQVISTFSMVALFIACLGLLGLTSYVTEQRKKEIGIRKVQGATTGNIVKLITSEFMVLVIIANIIAWPVAYYFMNKWLLDFAYRIHINIWIFIVAGTITFIIALLTVSYQAIKAALANPIKSLKYE